MALSLVSWEQSQAQFYLDIFPSQDSTNNTLWVFSGSSTARAHNSAGPYVRTSGIYNLRDTHKTSQALLRSGDGLHALTPLFTASATNAPLDLESLRTRLGQTIKLGTTNTNDDITIPSTATNVPTLTFGSSSRTIANMLLRDVPGAVRDDIGPRVGGSGNFNYDSSGVASSWSGAAVMAKPIGDFVLTTPGTYNGNRLGNNVLGSFTSVSANQGLRIRVHGAVIPEPEEYALVFALFALAFVLFHRHRQKKRRQQASAS